MTDGSSNSDLFAGVALVSRIERAECRHLAGSAAAAAERRPKAGVLVRELSGGVATYTGPGSPLNKIAGLGFGGPVDEEELARIERAFAERGIPVQAEVSCLADPSVGALLTQRGYFLVNFENVLGRPLPVAGLPEAPPGLDISVADATEVEKWLDVLVTGFAHADTEGVPSHESYSREAMEDPIGDMAAAGGFHCYLARRDGALAGAAGLHISDGVAQFRGAATLPEHRRRGVQSSLLARRLRDAADRGCDLAVVTTQPGSKSQENVQRHGFALLYTRAVLVRGVPG